MKQVCFFLIFIFILSVNSLQSQETKIYRLYLKDKGNTPYSLSKPEDFLSLKSIERRVRQNLPVDNFDLPVDKNYFEAITKTGAKIVAQSKWVKTVTVHLADIEILSQLENLPFVDSLLCVWKGVLPQRTITRMASQMDSDSRQNDINSYGAGFTQIAINNGHLLHNEGFRGKGMSIALLDAGFINSDRIDFFNQERIKEIKNFNHEVNDILRESHDHGTRVLSCMLSYKSGEMIGTAPEADYYLFRTEVIGDEYPVEEDYWIAALEYADSLGVDIVTSSLGYTTFDDKSMNHTKEQLDGKTIPISIAANLAASRGILLFNSAGNEGGNSWRKINFPGDAENVITVGSVTKDSVRSSFSSHGFTADKRVKPDVMSMGSGVSVIGSSGKIEGSNGTSFSAPVLAGLTACLWEALPELNSFSILKLLRETADRFQNPDSLMGYGIANIYKAYKQNFTGIQQTSDFSGQIYFSVFSFDNRLYINLNNEELYNSCLIDIYSTIGNRMLSVKDFSGSIDISSLPKGIYIACLKISDKQYIRKFIKN